MPALRTAIAITAALLATVPAVAQGTPPTCEDGWTLHDGANGMPYCLPDGVPSISNRPPDDALAFLPGCDPDNGLTCTVTDEERIDDPRFFHGVAFTFTKDAQWVDEPQGGHQWDVRGADGRALFPDSREFCFVAGAGLHGNQAPVGDPWWFFPQLLIELQLTCSTYWRDPICTTGTYDPDTGTCTAPPPPLTGDLKVNGVKAVTVQPGEEIQFVATVTGAAEINVKRPNGVVAGEAGITPSATPEARPPFNLNAPAPPETYTYTLEGHNGDGVFEDLDSVEVTVAEPDDSQQGPAAGWLKVNGLKEVTVGPGEGLDFEVEVENVSGARVRRLAGEGGVPPEEEVWEHGEVGPDEEDFTLNGYPAPAEVQTYTYVLEHPGDEGPQNNGQQSLSLPPGTVLGAFGGNGNSGALPPRQMMRPQRLRWQRRAVGSGPPPSGGTPHRPRPNLRDWNAGTLGTLFSVIGPRAHTRPHVEWNRDPAFQRSKRSSGPH